MSLPTGIDYAAPVGDLPPSRAPWTLECSRAAVLVHDLQRYFLAPFVAGCPALVGALDATAQIVAAARAAGVPVFYSAQTGDQPAGQRGLQQDLWGAGMRAIPEHVEIVEQVAPAPGDVVLTKHRYSAFARSPLAEHLVRERRDQLVITGVYAHIGVAATALEAFQREVQPFVVADGVADLGEEHHRRALVQVATCAGVVTTADVVLAAFTAPGAPGGAPAGDVGAADLGGDVDAAEPGGDRWEPAVRTALAAVLPAATVEAAFAESDADLFRLGLTSLQAFDLLDILADEGADIDYAAFTRCATVSFLREQGRLVAR